VGSIVVPDPAPPPLLVKGSYLRAYGATLKKLGLYDAVFATVSPRVREALASPPPASVWVDYGIGIEIFTAVEQLKGKAALRSFAHEATLSGIAPFMQNLIQGMMRLFGVSPATIFRNMNKLVRQTSRSGEFTYAATSDSSGIVTMTVTGHRDVPSSLFTASAGGLEVTFDSCGVIGHVQDPIMKENGLNNTADYRVSWRTRT
jgi:hypothetical protein